MKTRFSTMCSVAGRWRPAPDEGAARSKAVQLLLSQGLRHNSWAEHGTHLEQVLALDTKTDPLLRSRCPGSRALAHLQAVQSVEPCSISAGAAWLVQTHTTLWLCRMGTNASSCREKGQGTLSTWQSVRRTRSVVARTTVPMMAQFAVALRLACGFIQ
eukprot:2279553-Rhodomonas_salina.1